MSDALALDAPFRDGDVAAIRRGLGDPAEFPNVSAGPAFGTCLVYAIYHGPLSLIRELLELGADPNADDGDGFPPSIAALSTTVDAPGASVRPDAREVVELLLDRGADVGQRGINDYTALHVAAERGDLAMVELLLAHGADPDAITRIDDMETAVEIASAAGHAAVVDRLKPLTKRLDWEDAAKAGDVAVLRRMIAAGQNVDATDGYSQTALMRAAHAGRTDAVDLLVAEGADLDRSAKFGLTAMMLAVISGHARIARGLMAAGADTTRTGTGAPGFAGRTAADLAGERGDRRLAADLRVG